MKPWRLLLVVFLSILVWQFLVQFFFCTQFRFTKSSPFAGKIIVNPYDSIDASSWIKCNFHAHSTAWKGVTNGEGTSSEIHHAYDSLNYGIHCVSNYHSIDTNRISQGNYIPAYEHGYNLLKTHQLVLGSKAVCWLDYLLPQTLSNKQDILNYLVADTNAVVVLNHPAMRKGYDEKDLPYLNNYHCMEVLNPAGTSFPQWDAALSAGKRVFIVGNDDLHNVIKKERLGRMCTFVNANLKKDQVLKALKSGASYGVVIGSSQHPDSIPKLNALSLRKDTILLEMSVKASSISFIGQNGRNLASFSETDQAAYTLKPEDHYARAVITYPNGTSVYLNPVFYSQSLQPIQQLAIIDLRMTIFHRAIGFCLAGFYIFWGCIFIQGKKSIYIKLPSFGKGRKSRRWKKKQPALT